jgi:hypothetical protein
MYTIIVQEPSAAFDIGGVVLSIELSKKDKVEDPLLTMRIRNKNINKTVGFRNLFII